MAIIESLKEAYYSAEDKWYGFVDGVSDKVPVFGGLVDGLEDKGIPTFPLAIVIVLILLLLIFVLVFGMGNSSVTISILDNTNIPVEGASVVVLSGETQIDQRQSGADGKASFLLANGTYTIRAQKETYTTITKEITVNASLEEDLILGLEDTTITKAVYLKTADGANATGSGTLTYKCKGTNEELFANYANGQFTATVKKSCKEIELLSIQSYNIVSATAAFSGSSAVTVEKQVVQTGSVSVNLSVEGSSVVPMGLKVKLVPMDGTLQIEDVSKGTTIVQFTSVPVKKYYLYVSSPDGNFVDYDGSKLGEMKDVTKDNTTIFTAILKKATRATIKVNVTNVTTAAPVASAEVKLTSATNSTDVRTKLTGATGQLTFDVADGTSYIITVDHPDYVIGETKQATAGDTVDISLTKVDESNSNSILVRVVDSKKMPIDNARVILKKIDTENPVVGERTTGATGEAEFFNLELQRSYIASVSKEGFGSVDSIAIQITPRTQKVLEVVFDIGMGNVKLRVMAPDKSPLSGVSVKAINYYTGKQEGSSILTSTEGIADFSSDKAIRMDKKVYFIIESSGYSKYFTSAFYPAAITEKDVILSKPTASVLATIVGIYSGSAEVKGSTDATATTTTATVAQGTYTVKAVVQVPKGVYNEAGLHLRTGKQTAGVTNLMEEDGLNLTRVESSGRITKGTTYTPPSGYAKDSANLTQGDAKWADSVWKNPQEGTYEVEADIYVSETNPNAPLNLYYRGWVKGSTVLRDPVMKNPASNELYSDAKNRVIMAGAGSMCVASFCKAYTIEALSGSEAGKKKYVNGTFEAKKDVPYLLTADLTNYSGRVIPGAVLSVEGKSLDVNGITVNGNDQEEKTTNLGALGIDAPLQVQVVFTPKVAGTSGIKLNITSGSKTELDETVTINVKANKKFALTMIPVVIIPYLENSLFFEAKDGNSAIEGVLLTIKSGKDLLGTVETTGEGLANYVLASPKIGDEITITAKKEGYDNVEITKLVDKQLLTITPPEISETIKVGDVTAIAEQIIMQNNTARSVKITGTEINGDLKNYLDIKFIGTIAGTIIESGKDRNYELSIKLGPNAMRLVAPKDVSGTLIINTEVSGTAQTFSNEMKIDIRISMPGYLDSGKCLKVNPTSVEFITSDGEVSKTVTLTNNCTAEGVKVALNNLEAKLSEASKFGTVSISGKGFTNASISDNYTKVAEYFESDAEEVLTIRFSPNTAVASGKQEFTISLVGKNILEDKTEEKVEAQIKTSITMSNLSKCVEIEKPQGGILLDIAPWNMGYGRLMMSDYSSQMSAYGQNYGGLAMRGGNQYSMSPYGMGAGGGMSGMGMQGYGSSGYGSGYGGMSGGMGTGSSSYGQNGGSSTMSYEQNSFTIKNNCATDIDIDLDPDPRINVSEEKFTISKDSDATVIVQPGYVLGKYKVVVNAKPTGTEETKKKIDTVSVLVRRLGDIDRDCIKTNVTHISLNSFIYKPQSYSVYNYCYDTGVQLSRGNNMATIECSAPQAMYGGQNQQYFQQGAESSYSQAYPLGGASGMQSYNQYTQMSACQSAGCSLIAGTRVRYRDLQQGNNGSVEKVDFEIMPSAQYIPQRKLFNSQSGTYGLFQNLGDIRQWGTETNARTDVYGDLRVSYSNQYGSNECIDFPITLSDMWRLGESIDSAINWGDSSAKPADCQNSDALNIRGYWQKRGSSSGAIPEEQYQGNSYKYIAEPPALRIGPAPTMGSQYYPAYDYSYFRNTQQEANINAAGASSSSANPSGANASSNNGTASKNCGILDSITVVTKISPEKAGGARITVLETGSGSLFKNTRGSNLMVEVDRSAMTADCILLQVPVTGKVTRAISFESQELVWPLTVLITRKGVTVEDAQVEAKCKIISADAALLCEERLKQALIAAGLDAKSTREKVAPVVEKFLKENPDCVKYINLDKAMSILAAGTVAAGENACGEGAKIADYGMDKIGATKLTKVSEPVDCTQYFCNGEMLQGYLLNKFAKIKEAVDAAKTAGKINAPSGGTSKELNKLYREAGVEINDCTGKLTVFKNESGALIKVAEGAGILGAALTATNKTVIEQKADTALSAMEEVLRHVGLADAKDILIEVDPLAAHEKQFTDLKMTKIKDKYYISKDAYQAIITGVNANKDKCSVNGTSCTINWCGTTVELTPLAFQYLSGNKARLVKGVAESTADMNVYKIEIIYKANPALLTVHNLALFSTELKGKSANTTLDKDLLLTTIVDTRKRPEDVIFTGSPDALKNFTLEFSKPTTTVGQYNVELSYDYGTNANKASVTLSEAKPVEGATKATSNVLLKSGFDLVVVDEDNVMSDITGKIISESAGKYLFYKKVPIKFIANVNGEEVSLLYKLDIAKGKDKLMNWYDSLGTTLGTDALSGVNYVMRVPNSKSIQTMRGMFYAPQGAVVVFYPGAKTGYQLSAKTPASAFGETVNPTATEMLTGTKTGSIQVLMQPEKITLDAIVAQIKGKEQNACINENGVIWNEKKLVQGS